MQPIFLCLHHNTINMTQIILKDDIEQSKIDALLFFLKSWDIDVVNITKSKDFALSQGIWIDYEVDSKELRDKAWKR